MNKMETLIKEAYANLKAKRRLKERPSPPTDEDIACHATSLFNEKERQKLLDNIILEHGEETGLKYSFLLADGIRGESREDVPEYLVSQVKDMVSSSKGETVLDAVVEFAGDIVHVIRTTGTILTWPEGKRARPAMAFRSRDAERDIEMKTVAISKAVNSYIIDIKIIRVKDDMANLTVQVKNKKGKMPSQEERISLVHQNREIRSSITEIGKVEFENIRLMDYEINLVRKGEPHCVAVLSLRAPKE